MGQDRQQEQERRWLVACQRGDRPACAQVVRAYQDAALRSAFLLTNDRQAAEDVAQNAFLTTLRHLGRYDPARPFRPWFFTILINEARMYLRRERSRAALRLDDARADAMADDAEPHDALLIRADERAHVRRAVAELAEPYRTAIVLYYVSELSIDEVAAATESAPGTVKSRLHRGRERLRVLLASPAAEAAEPSDHIWRATR